MPFFTHGDCRKRRERRCFKFEQLDENDRSLASNLAKLYIYFKTPQNSQVRRREGRGLSQPLHFILIYPAVADLESPHEEFRYRVLWDILGEDLSAFLDGASFAARRKNCGGALNDNGYADSMSRFARGTT